MQKDSFEASSSKGENAQSHQAIDLQIMWNRLLALVEEQGQVEVFDVNGKVIYQQQLNLFP